MVAKLGDPVAEEPTCPVCLRMRHYRQLREIGTRWQGQFETRVTKPNRWQTSGSPKTHLVQLHEDGRIWRTWCLQVQPASIGDRAPEPEPTCYVCVRVWRRMERERASGDR
jgi:hypothetical protein